MSICLKPITALGVVAVLLAACTAPDGTPMANSPRVPAFGGLIGAITGSGQRKPGKTASAGMQTGTALSNQQAALRAALGEPRIRIVNSGAALVLTLPASLAFQPADATLRDSLKSDLAALAANLVQFPHSTIVIAAHTDNTGPASQNTRLSQARAEVLMAALVANGVGPGRMRAIGRGEELPIATNLTPEGRARNRRIEITIRPAP